MNTMELDIIDERLEFLGNKYTTLEVMYHQRDSLELSGELVDAIVFELGRIADEVSCLFIKKKNLSVNLPFYP